MILGAFAAAGCFVTLPAMTFRAHSVLILEGGTAPLQATLIRIAADSAVSKPVIDRAAAMLLASDVKAPAPDLSERLSVTAGTKGATSRQARLADAIAPAVRSDPGVVPGTLEISAVASRPEEAARTADALAEAFVTQQDDAAIQARTRQDEKVSARVEGAKVAALAARQRLIALGGATMDPLQARNAAAAQTAAAETRLASIRAIMASSSPPLSDRKDLPPALSMPQAAYLDLKSQLEKQSETLGDRHTIIIALQEGVKHAATTLSAEWNRLKKIAEADVVAAREHETALRKNDSSTDTKRHDAIEDARRAVQTAEDAVATTRKQQDIVPDEATFHMIARAPVPKLANGYTLVMRLTLSMLAGLAGLVLALGARRLLSIRREAEAPAVVHAAVPATHDLADPEPHAAPATLYVVETAAPQPAAPEVAQSPMPTAGSASFFDEVVETAPTIYKSSRLRRPAPQPSRPKTERSARSVAAPLANDGETNLVDQMRAVLDTIESMQLRDGVRATIIVAANEDGVASTPVALALGRAAADRRWHVLLVEAERANPVLAAAANLDAEPVLIDLYGTLRVGLSADCAGSLTLAPVLRDAARLASNLAMNPRTPMIDDLASAFDLVVIDGGVAEDTAAAGWTADAFVRVASRSSRRDDDAFCSTFEVASSSRLATILPFAPQAEQAPAPASRLQSRSGFSRPKTSGPLPLHPRPQSAPASATATRRKFAFR